MEEKNVFFPPIKTVRVSEIVESSIKDFILKARLKPGDRLPSQNELSEQFNVSIITVREALSGLQALGLIEKKKGKGGGIFVSDIQEDSLKTTIQSFFTWKNVTAHHLIEARVMIEPLTARKAMEGITPAELEELKENVIRCEEKIREMEEIQGELPIEEYFEIEKINIEFHRILARATHNPVLSLTMDCVMDFLHNFERVVLTPNIEYSKLTVREHRELISLIEAGDVDKFEQSMIQHIHHMEDEIWNKEK